MGKVKGSLSLSYPDGNCFRRISSLDKATKLWLNWLPKLDSIGCVQGSPKSKWVQKYSKIETSTKREHVGWNKKLLFFKEKKNYYYYYLSDEKFTKVLEAMSRIRMIPCHNSRKNLSTFLLCSNCTSFLFIYFSCLYITQIDLARVWCKTHGLVIIRGHCNRLYNLDWSSSTPSINKK